MKYRLYYAARWTENGQHGYGIFVRVKGEWPPTFLTNSKGVRRSWDTWAEAANEARKLQTRAWEVFRKQVHKWHDHKRRFLGASRAALYEAYMAGAEAQAAGTSSFAAWYDAEVKDG
jgi:hypothetical protein